jgi:hypothetical protein
MIAWLADFIGFAVVKNELFQVGECDSFRARLMA